MMENYLLSIIPFVLIQTVYGNTPDAPGIQFNVKSPVEYKTGDTITVICSLTDSTPSGDSATLRWYDPNKTEITATFGPSPHVVDVPGPKRFLILEAAIIDYAGKYSCEATVNDAKYEDTLVIEVRAALNIIDCDEEQYGVKGQTSTISCKASISTAYAMWERRPPMKNETDKYIRGPTGLVIHNTEEDDAGTYTYRVISMGTPDNKFKRISFEVDIAPTITSPVLQTTAVVGKPATLYCNAKGKPDPNIEWRKKGSTNVIVKTDRIEARENKKDGHVQGILNFTSVERGDASEYTCTAKNRASDKSDEVGVAETSGQLIVLIPPTFEDTEDGKGIEGGTATLKCVARGEPIPDMVWVNKKTKDRYSKGTTKDGKSAVQTLLRDQPDNLGAMLTLQFDPLKHDDAGEYICEASNAAAEVEMTVNLEVEYKPNFNDQGKTVFYNWEGYKESYITCTANGNPLPGFMWYKVDKKQNTQREITAGDNFHKIETPETDPENAHRVTSKLLVTYNGNNAAAVFGDYKCETVNLRGRSEIALSMVQAERPGKPTVDVRTKDPKIFEIWLFEPAVKGPEVTHFKVTYLVQGGSAPAVEKTFEKEYREHIDVGRKYTKIIIENLLPNTFYVFTFIAINPVGEGTPVEMTIDTPPITKPKMPEITTQANSPFSTSINLQWRLPGDGGSQILEYIVTYQRVNVNKNKTYEGTRGYEVLDKISTVSEEKGIQGPPFTIKNLIPGQFYEVKIYARNGEGRSPAGMRVIRTQEDPRYNPDTSKAPRCIAGNVSMAMFGCLVALSACLKSFM